MDARRKSASRYPAYMDVTIADFVPFVLIPFIAWGVRRYKRQQDDFGPLKQKTFAIGIGAYFVTEMARSFYRPFIYANEISDFHIADTIGNSTGTVTALFMVLTMMKTGQMKDSYLFALIGIGLIGYEVLSGTGSRSVDTWDVAATLLFTACSVVLYFGYLKPNLK